MAGAVNKVIAGDYQNYIVSVGFGGVYLSYFFKKIKLDKSTVSSYELITDEHKKSAVSSIGRGLVGGALLGPVGMLGGALSAKNKGIYQVAIQFSDGKRSLLELDDKTYKGLMKAIF